MRTVALRWVWVAALALGLAGSAASFGYADPSPTQSWVGRTQKELIATLGDPASVRVRPDGTLLLEYLIERNGMTCRVVYLALPDGRIAAEKDDCV